MKSDEMKIAEWVKWSKVKWNTIPYFAIVGSGHFQAPSWAVAGQSWARLGHVLGASGAVLGAPRCFLGALGYSWARLGHILDSFVFLYVLFILRVIVSSGGCTTSLFHNKCSAQFRNMQLRTWLVQKHKVTQLPLAPSIGGRSEIQGFDSDHNPGGEGGSRGYDMIWWGGVPLCPPSREPSKKV